MSESFFQLRAWRYLPLHLQERNDDLDGFFWVASVHKGEESQADNG